MKAIGVMPQMLKPRISFSPPMKLRENGGISLPPKPVISQVLRWKAMTFFLLKMGEGLKYFTSIAGRSVLTLPPSTLPEPEIEKKMLLPPVGLMGLLTVL